MLAFTCFEFVPRATNAARVNPLTIVANMRDMKPRYRRSTAGVAVAKVAVI